MSKLVNTTACTVGDRSLNVPLTIIGIPGGYPFEITIIGIVNPNEDILIPATMDILTLGTRG
jgi:hypothetical protein